MILLIDNYDSFSYNLYQLIGELNPDIRAVRNDEMTAEEIADMGPEAVVLSPGPGRPAEAGSCEEIVQKLGGRLPILGVCLGHQAVCEALGAEISHAKELMHGKQSLARLDTSAPLFAGLPEKIPVARYHSLAVRKETLPDTLREIARTDDGEVMAVAHREFMLYGLQFHPESILTPDGKRIIKNFLEVIRHD